MKIWAAWQAVKNSNKSKPAKLPMSYQVNPNTGETEVRPASCSDPTTWMTYDDAVKLLKSSKKFKGLQVALSSTPPKEGDNVLVAGDIDKAFRKDGTVDPEKLADVLAMGTYAEYSPTEPSPDHNDGGLRFLCYGNFPVDAGKHAGDIEVYQNSKWITITGHRLLEAPATVNHAQDALDTFRSKYFTPYEEIDTSDLPVTNVDFTDEQIINRLEHAFNDDVREAFNHLFYKGVRGADQTVDDLALCNLIRGWTQKPEQIDSIFRQSKLMRPKWDEVHYANGDTYGQHTIKVSLGSRTKDTWVYMEQRAPVLPEQIDWSTFDVCVGSYRVNSSGIFLVKVDKEGEEIETRIARNPGVLVARGKNQDNSQEKYYKILIKIKGSDDERTVWRSSSGLLTKSGVMELINMDLQFPEANCSLMNSYFFTFLTLYEDTLTVETVAMRSGWKNNYSEFVIGNRSISAKGVSDITQIDNSAVDMYGQVGSAEGWAEGVDDIMKFPQIRFKAYAACGCLVLRITDVENYIFDQCCGTTRLKTFSNKLVASMFGHPKTLQISARSTALGIEKTAAACNDLPLFMDETSENVQFVMELIYRFANSNTRAKSNTASGLEMSKQFCSGLLLTGEDSIITESSKGGHHARRVPETHGVPEDANGNPIFITEDVKLKVKKAMNNNYGNIVDLFVQELMTEINNIGDLYVENFQKLPDTGTNALAGRLKGYYTVMLIAGQILERVFVRLGMTPCDPLEIVTGYFNENVSCGVTVPDHIKILRVAYDMYVSEKRHFGATAGSTFIVSDRADMNAKFGWVDIKNGVTTINFLPQALKDRVVKSLGNGDGENRYESAVKQWGSQGILNRTVTPDKKTGKSKVINTRQIRTDEGTRPWVLQIPLANFYKHLGMEEDSDSETETPDEAEVSAPVKKIIVEDSDIIIPEDNASIYDVIMGEMGGVL